jgi:hypothetical protein
VSFIRRVVRSALLFFPDFLARKLACRKLKMRLHSSAVHRSRQICIIAELRTLLAGSCVFFILTRKVAGLPPIGCEHRCAQKLYLVSKLERSTKKFTNLSQRSRKHWSTRAGAAYSLCILTL